MNAIISTKFSKTILIEPEKKIEIHRAGWIIVNPWHIIKNGYVIIEDRIIKEVSGSQASMSTVGSDIIIDHGPGVLMPPLVNAHTHLELSCFKGKLETDKGFEAWVRELLKLREISDEKIVLDHAAQSINDLYKSGVLYVGDTSTTGITKKVLEESCLCGVWFHEFLGSKADMDESMICEKSEMLSFGFAGHAPHTTSPKLLQLMKKQTNATGLPFSIHVDESKAEQEFISTGKGKWAQFLKERKIDYSSWGLPKQSSVVHLFNHGLLDSSTLVVHVLNSDDNDFEIIYKSGVKVCVCPRSNMNLHGKLPQLEKMLNIGLKPALGTDSLASCDSLNIFDEMEYIADNYNIAPPDILAMATQYGADALGMGKYTGSLEKGRRADMLYVHLKAETEKRLLEKLTGYE